MGIPILTSEGFVGQRWIIDDYFRAGETLHCGDVVAVRQRTTSPHEPRVFKATTHGGRVIGIVHTPAAKEVGDEMATTGTTAAEDEFVPVVVKGIAKALSAGAISVGDPVVASRVADRPLGKSSLVARVEESRSHNHFGSTSEAGEHSHTVGVSAGTQGPPGPQGPVGPAGPQGPRGLRGFTGSPGQDGADGRDGEDGRDGAPGRQGPPGQDGEDGQDGATGRQGPPGQDGEDGQDGATGRQGPPGSRGSRGPQGPQGPRGLRGPRGFPGTCSCDQNDDDNT